MANPYVKQTWVDNNVANPTSAARMGVLEQGIFDAHYQPAVQASHNTTQSIANNTSTALACNIENFDQASNVADTMHDTVTNNSRLTCRYAGIYLVNVSAVTWSANPVNGEMHFRLSGGANTFGGFQVVGDVRIMETTAVRVLAVNDYIECMVTQVSGGSLTVGAFFTFSMVRVA